MVRPLLRLGDPKIGYLTRPGTTCVVSGTVRSRRGGVVAARSTSANVLTPQFLDSAILSGQADRAISRRIKPRKGKSRDAVRSMYL